MSDREEDSTQIIPCHGQPAMSDSCNRQPFASDDECERGTVDIHQFDDLPYCEHDTLPHPKIPPETSDVPWINVIPPPCSCINIDYKFDFKGYKDEFNAKAEFKSVSDCCEGGYETKFEFELECPIGDFEPKTFKASLSWNCDTEFEQDYIKPKEDECGIEPSDINFCIGLPCPVGVNDDKDDDRPLRPHDDLYFIPDDPIYGSVKFYFYNVEMLEDRVGQYYSVGFRNKWEGGWDNHNWWRTLRIRPGDGVIIEPQPQYGTFYINGKKASDIAVRSYLKKAGILSDVPDGRTERDDRWGQHKDHSGEPGSGIDPGEMRIAFEWEGVGHTEDEEKEKFVTVDEDECKMTAESPDITLTVPCPIVGGERKIKTKLGWNCEHEQEHVYYNKVDGECEIEPKDVEFNIGLPCPIKGEDECNITISLDWKNEDRTLTIPYLTSKKEEDCPEGGEGESSAGTCEITPVSPEFNLSLPCPIPEKEKKLKISLDWKEEQTDLPVEEEKTIIRKVTSDGCELDVSDVSFDLGLPCPIPEEDKKLKISLDWKNEKQEDEKPIIKKKDDECDIDTEDVEFELSLPCPIPEEEKKLKISLDWKNEKQEDEKPIIKKKDDECDIDTEDVEFELGLPCPIPELDETLSITLNWDEENSDRKTIIKKGDDCEIDIDTNIEFNLGLPCPINEKEVKISIDWTDDESKKTDTQKVIEKSGDCEISSETVEFELGLPCPIKNDTASARLYLEWDAENEADIEVVKKSSGSDCEIELSEEEYTIGLPCPVSGINSNISINMAWGSSPSATLPLIESSSDCQLNVQSPSFDIGLPCPLDNLDATLTIALSWDAEEQTQTKSILKSGSNCTVSSESADFNLGLPCPFEGNYARIKASISYGEDFNYDTKIAVDNTKEGCNASLVDMEGSGGGLELTIPCPLDRLKLAGTIEDSEDDEWELTVDDTEGGDTSEECSKDWTIKLKAPKEECITVITGATFSMPTITFTTKQICGRFKVEDGTTETVDLPTAGHVNKCCGGDEGGGGEGGDA